MSSVLPVQTTLARDVALQVVSRKGLWGHCDKENSNPLHSNCSTQVCPVWCPDSVSRVILWAFPQSSCLHTTVASFISQVSAHKVPHWPLSYSSTIPAQRVGPLDNFTLPGNHRSCSICVRLHLFTFSDLDVKTILNCTHTVNVRLSEVKPEHWTVASWIRSPLVLT